MSYRTHRWLILPVLIAFGCASDPAPRTLLADHPGYGELSSSTASRNSQQGGQVAHQGCEALHRGYVAKSQRWVDCAAGDQELRIQLHGLPDPEKGAEAATELVSMIAMVESSWCLSRKLVLGNEESAVTVIHPDGRSTTTSCAHFMER